MKGTEMKSVEYLCLKKVKAVHIIILALATAAVSCVMNFYLIPLITENAAYYGLTVFDMRPFGYSYEYAQELVTRLSTEQMEIYLNVQLPLDMIFPLIYTALLSVIFIKTRGVADILSLLPILLMLADYTENILSIIILKNSKNILPQIVQISSTATVIKNILMCACILLALIFTIVYTVRKIKANTGKKS